MPRRLHRRIVSVTLPLCLGFGLPAAAGAQGFGLGPRLAVVRGDLESGTSTGRYTGGFLRLHPSPRTGLELSLDWRTVVDETRTTRVRDYPIQASLLLYPVRSVLAPYVLGGVGWYSQRLDTLGAEGEVVEGTTTRKMGYHAGLGGELRLGRHAAIYLDYRYTFVRFGDRDEEPGGPPPASAVPVVGDLAGAIGLSHRGSMWAGGLTVYF
ncbi:MAG TPA: outer membrane beta-barrel protein [Vicinamibacterales bacterium]|nr:outer membrane beta-barrel protein [Vicinamibacterales bacterium]